MDFLNDPDMKEIVEDFGKEAKAIFGECEEELNLLEDDLTQKKHLEAFGQKIDRVMGAAKSIGLDEISLYCELGKTIGYKSSQGKDLALTEVVVAILFDSIDLLNKMVDALLLGKKELTANINLKAFGTRLHWLSAKFKDIERASCTVKEEEKSGMDQGGIDDLLKDLGL
jgi:chemotaxis protein histidine kinase CheA